DTLIGEAGIDTLVGGAGNDDLQGGADNDLLEGEGGADTLDGGDGDDQIALGSDGTGPGNDTVTGGDGNDQIFHVGLGHGSTTGADTVDAGAGDDYIQVYLLNSGAADHTLTLGSGRDEVDIRSTTSTSTTIPAAIITDFAPGFGGDVINLNSVINSSLTGWDGSTNPFDPSVGFLQLIQSGSDVILQIDPNGGGDNWRDLVVFQNTTLANFTDANFTPQFDAISPGVNDVPAIGGDLGLTVQRDVGSVVITLDDLDENDPDDTLGALTYSVLNPTNGHVAFTSNLAVAITSFTQQDLVDGIVAFVHDGSSGTSAGFDVVLTDDEGANSGAPQAVSVSINDAPVAQNDAFTTDEDVQLSGNVLADNGNGADSDPNSNPVTVSLVTDVSNGTLVLNPNGSFTYTPNQNFNGPDSFTYEIDDGNGGTDTATATITVDAVNDAPSGAPTATLANGTEDTAYTVSAADLLAGFSDVDLDVLSVANLVASAGTVTDNLDGTYTVALPANFNGTVTLTYDVSDGTDSLTGQTLDFTVDAVNDPPTGAPTATLANGIEDIDYTVSAADLLAGFSDVDMDLLSVANLVASAGTVTDNLDGTYTVALPANFNGTVTLTYDVTDGTDSLTGQTLDFTVDAVNDVPTGAPTATLANGTEDTAYTVSAADLLAGFSDVDLDLLSVANLVASAGTVTDNLDGTYTVALPANFNGTVTLTYDVSDGTDSLTGQTLDFTVDAVNDPPEAGVVDLGGIYEGGSARIITAVELLAGVTDIDTLPPGLSITSLTLQSGNGSLVDNLDGTWTYTPAADETAVVFDYTASDGEFARSSTATLNVAPQVSLANTTTTIAENTATPLALADIIVDDPDGGTNILSLSGADADAFEIVGGQLVVRASTVLDFETQSTYEVTVNVDDSTIGASPDGSVTYTLTVTDVDETGTGGNDVITGTPGSDIIFGGAGNDRIFASGSFDVIDGGPDNDTFDLATSTGGINWVSFDAPGSQFRVDTGTGFVGQASLSNFENVSDSSGRDIFHGNAADNTYFYSAGFDTFDGNGGIDTLDISAMTANLVWINLTAASSQLRSNDGSGWVANAVLSDVERFVTTGQSDYFYGDATGSTFVYMGGRDFISAAGGSDWLDMSAFADRSWVNLNIASDQFRFNNGAGWVSGGNMSGVENVIGSDGDDYFYADGADNSYLGGLGNDYFDGGLGDDTFILDGVLGDYAVSINSGTYTFAGISGTDTLIGVEFVQIGGITYALDTFA
ncbi:MAG: cadherin-like domain-containing protein, partial [Hyphomicrobiaceae bacterium]|nr:cadherin-like domain-containing protein [Hyphomicrobiaceae bacterium]